MSTGRYRIGDVIKHWNSEMVCVRLFWHDLARKAWAHFLPVRGPGTDGFSYTARSEFEGDTIRRGAFSAAARACERRADAELASANRARIEENDKYLRSIASRWRKRADRFRKLARRVKKKQTIN